MPKPTPKVEIAFNCGVTGTPTWTDVTTIGKVRINPGINAKHWRDDEDSTCQPSSLTVTLRNDDGRFTPGNTASPYYPNVTKGRRIRVTCVSATGATFTRFYGFINDWSVDWPAKVGAISECTVTASSRMAVLGRGAELRSIVEEEILSDVPVFYYALTEPEGATAAGDTSGGSGASVLTPQGAGGAITFGVTGFGPDALTAASFAANGQYLDGTPPAPSGGMTAFVRTASPAPSGTKQSIFNHRGRRVWLNDDGTVGGSNNASLTLTSTTNIANNADHHIALTISGLTVSLLIDGVVEASGSGVGQVVAGPLIGDQLGVTMVIGHVAGFSTAPSTARIAAHASAGLVGDAGETPAARITRYARYAGMSTADLDLDSGQVQDLAHIDTTGRTALDCMRDVETTEGGVLFDTLDGTLAFRDRASRYTAAAYGGGAYGGGPYGGGPDGTDFTLSYSAGHIANPIRPVLDDQQQCNDMTNTNANGVTGRAFDQTSINDHGLYRDGLTLATTDPDEPLIRASWVVNRHKDPLTRTSEVEVCLNTLPDDLTDAVLGAQVGTIFTLKNLPANAPASQMDLFVEGREDRITGDEDRIVLRCSPASVYQVFMLDDPTRGLDSGYPLAY